MYSVLNQKYVGVLIAVHTAVGVKTKISTSRLSSSRCQDYVLDVVNGAAAGVVNGAAHRSRNGNASRGFLNEMR